MKLLSIDQSFAKTAYIVSEDGKPLRWGVIRTGESKSKEKKKNVAYFDTTFQQILFILKEIMSVVDENQPDYIAIEGLAFSAKGNQTRNLAGLFYGLHLVLDTKDYKEKEELLVFAPTQVKSYAKTLSKEPLKGIVPKKMMITLAEQEWPDVLKGYTVSGVNSGKEDLADALHIMRYFWDKVQK